MRRLGKLPSQISNTFFHAFTMRAPTYPNHRDLLTFHLDNIKIYWIVAQVRKLASFLVILLLITAYGRCVADQLGVLHTTGSTCCQVVCGGPDHCDPDVEQPTQDHEHHEHSTEEHACDTGHGEERNNSNGSQDKDQDKEESPAPCQLCSILDSDSILQGESIKIPSPSLFELKPLFYFSAFDVLIQPVRPVTSLDKPLSNHPDTPVEQCSQIRRTIAKTTPVRGPSLV